MNRYAALLPLLAFFAMPAASPACASSGSLVLDLDHAPGEIRFRALGRPAAIHILGSGAAPHGKLTYSETDHSIRGAAIFDLKTLTTGIHLRDAHMNKKYLETDRFPTATLKLTRLGLSSPLSAGADLKDVPFEGLLTLHGIERPVKGTVELKRNEARLAIQASFELNTEEFGIATPRFAGITVANEVTVTVTSDARIEPK